jgi:transcriptional regulator with XRE-family HTH domain
VSAAEKFKSRGYREACAEAYLRRCLISGQIRKLRKERGWTQEQLANAAGIKQSVISRAEDPNVARCTLTTLLQIAKGLDMAIDLKFTPFDVLAERLDSGEV